MQDPYWQLFGQDAMDGKCKENLRPKGDYGVRVARPGYDARYCAENQLLFNSGWPILQIAGVIDFSKSFETEVWWWNVNEGWLENEPDGLSSTIGGLPGLDGTISANRKYLKKCIRTTAWRKPNPDANAYPRFLTYYRCEFGLKRHRLGFTPAFLPAKMMALGSDIEDVVLLYSIDIETDIDYPYVETPLAMIRPQKDYGLKSSSMFGKRVPGLSSNQFSKLVQAVKTEKTAQMVSAIPMEGGSSREYPVPVWTPLKESMDVKSVPVGVLRDYEAMSFVVGTRGVLARGSGLPTRFEKEPSKDGGDWYRFVPTLVEQGRELYFNPIFPIDAKYYPPFAFAPEHFSSSADGILEKSTVVVLRKPLTASEEMEVRV